MITAENLGLASLCLQVALIFPVAGFGMRHGLGVAEWYIVREWWPWRWRFIAMGYGFALVLTIWCFIAAASEPAPSVGPKPSGLALIGWSMPVLVAFIAAFAIFRQQPIAEIHARIPTGSDFSLDSARRRLRGLLVSRAMDWRLLEELRDGPNRDVDWYGQTAPCLGPALNLTAKLTQMHLEALPRRALIIRFEDGEAELRLVATIRLLDYVSGPDAQRVTDWIGRERPELVRSFEALGWEVEAESVEPGSESARAADP